MIERTAKICILGTFDVENYGDDLFSLIAKEQLQKRIQCTVDFYSPIGGNNLLNDPELSVHSIGEFTVTRKKDFYENYDAIVVGGGEIIHFNELSLVCCYQTLGIQNISVYPNRSFFIHYSPAWKNAPSVCYNAIGATSNFTVLQSSIVNKTFSSARYIAVRDEISKKNLREAGVRNEIHVVPDSVFLIKEWSRSRLDKNSIHEIFRSNSIDITKKPLIGFQCNPAFLQRQQKFIAQVLIDFAEKVEGQIVLLPIGYCFEDERALREIKEQGNDRITLIRGKHSAIAISNIISYLDYFIGSSLHGNVTAIAFGIPHVGINTIGHPKLIAFFKEIKREKYCIEDWKDLVKLFDLMKHQNKEDINLLAGDNCRKVNVHFDRLASEIEKSMHRSFEKSKNQVSSIEMATLLQEEYKDLTLWNQVSMENYRGLIETLESDLKDRTSWALQLDAELNERRAYIKKLQQDFEERTQWALKLNEEVGRLQQITISPVYKILSRFGLLPKYK